MNLKKINKGSMPKVFIISVADEGWNMGGRSVFGALKMPLKGISDPQSPALRWHQRRFFVQ